MIIFLDANFDDIITLLMLINNNIHIDCIVVTSGWCHVGIGIANIVDILTWVGSNIPVFAGSLTTPNQESVFPESLYLIDTLWNTMRYVPRYSHCLPSPGTEYIEFCKNIDHPVDILVISPFTDVTAILDIVDIKYIYTLSIGKEYSSRRTSGARYPFEISTPDPISDTKHSIAESNIYLNPRAAAETLKKIGQKIIWLVAPYMNAIPVDDQLLSHIRNRYNMNKSRINLFVYKLIDNMVKTNYTESINVWDSTLALLILYPRLFTFKQQILSIDYNMSRVIRRTSSTITITEKYSTGLGLFLDVSNGTVTNVVDSMNSDRIYKKFINMF